MAEVARHTIGRITFVRMPLPEKFEGTPVAWWSHTDFDEVVRAYGPNIAWYEQKMELSASHFWRSEAKVVAVRDFKEAVPDLIAEPPHYIKLRPHEPIDVIETWGLNYRLGNVVSYIARAEHKGTKLQDLKKARQFLTWEIEALEKKNG